MEILKKNVKRFTQALHKLKVLYFLCCFFTILPCFGMEKEETSKSVSSKMKFKLGFEFQEGSGLCPWALDDFRVQKKPLFAIEKKKVLKTDKEENKSIPLWHVVLDTSDIEFVTRPFTESLSLKMCIETILGAFTSLRKLLETEEKTTFQQWTQQIVSLFEKEPFEVTYTNDFSLIKTWPIKKPKDWEPKFSPQVTVQHPLEYTIPLYFGLFGFKDGPMMPFVSSLPYRDLFSQFSQDADLENSKVIFNSYCTKTSGLGFLHALTLTQMTPDEDQTDKDLLKETANSFRDYQQVDAKMRLSLMSRRPFSSMLKNIKLDPTTSYTEFFNKSLVDNNSGFTKIYSVPTYFHRTNYAEQFFDTTTGKERNLKDGLKLLFKENFVQENVNNINNLLEKGIVSTTMLRNLKEGVKDEFISLINQDGVYFKRTIADYIENPAERYIIDINKSSVEKQGYSYDNLSPPWFLEVENSMGAIKAPLTEEEILYGEAIVEVRGIKSVGGWFLKKGNFSENSIGLFLTKPETSLTQEAIALFKFLEGFPNPSDMSDIRHGMSLAVIKY